MTWRDVNVNVFDQNSIPSLVRNKTRFTWSRDSPIGAITTLKVLLMSRFVSHNNSDTPTQNRISITSTIDGVRGHYPRVTDHCLGSHDPQADPGGPGGPAPLAPKIFFKIMPFSGNFRGRNAGPGPGPLGWKLCWPSLTKILDPPLSYLL